MKKYFFIAVAAVVALAACTKNNADTTAYEQSKVINFTAVTGKATKAPITNNYFMHGNSAFGVYACYLEDGKNWDSHYSASKLYMGTNNGAGVSVSYSTTDGINIWAPADTYYWPLQGGLTFFAYWPYTLDPDYTEGENELTFGSFTVEATVANQVDVLVSNFAKNQTQNTDTYTDGEVTSTVTGVPIQFNHMLSQVVFTAAASTNVYNRGLSFKIDNITVGARKTSAGMTVVPGGVPVWTDPTALQAFVVSNTAFPTSGYLNASQSAEIGDALLMIPIEDFLGADSTDGNKALSDNDDEYVSVTYTLYRLSDDLDMGSKTVKFWLNDNNGTVDSWEPGKKYTYQLTIDLEQIYFAPTVSSWVPENQTVDVPGNGVGI